MINILIATGNIHKLQEIKSIMGNFTGFDIIYLDKSFQAEIIENGKTYKENAKIKMDGYVKFLDENPKLKSGLSLDYIISEDSGLEAQCLGDIPGLITARFAGGNASDIENINKLLDMMRLKKDCMANRRAKFICLACLYDIKRGKFHYFKGELNGLISSKISGAGGFGYDPVFFVPEQDKTLAQIDSSEKNKISHRAIAFKMAAEVIKEMEQL